MKIRDLQARTVVAPLDPPVRTASGHVSQAPLLLIDLATDEGVVGCAYLFGYHAFTLGPLRELVLALGEGLKGDELAPVEVDRKLRAQMTLFGARGLQGWPSRRSTWRRGMPSPSAPGCRWRACWAGGRDRSPPTTASG